jgi:hypothetical protein
MRSPLVAVLGVFTLVSPCYAQLVDDKAAICEIARQTGPLINSAFHAYTEYPCVAVNVTTVDGRVFAVAYFQDESKCVPNCETQSQNSDWRKRLLVPPMHRVQLEWVKGHWLPGHDLPE